MFFLLIKNFISSRIVLGGFIIVLLSGFIGIYNGKNHLERLRNNIKETEHFQEEHINRNVEFFNKDIGSLLYYLRFAYVNEINPLNGLSIGQRDVNNSIQFINIRNLEAQKYDTDLYNPVNLLMGNLDFAFVLLFLFPLLIIAVNYNLLSEEKEGGTWPLVYVQSRHSIKVLLSKLAIRAIFIYGVLAILFIVSVWVMEIPFNSMLVATILLSCIYLLFWFILCFWVVSWRKSSAVNAVSLFTFWLLLTYILPAAINNFIIARYTVPEALATTVKQREGYHEKWDMDKNMTMEQFYTHYPQFRKYTLPETPFSWLWYFAMQQSGDDDARSEVLEFKAKLHQRAEASNRISQFIPTLHTQLKLNTFSQADLINHLHFMDSTEHFHERLRLYFYPRIFEGREAKQEDWTKFKPAYFKEKVVINPWETFLPQLVLTSILILLTVLNFRFRKIW